MDSSNCTVTSRFEDGTLTVLLSGHIDSSNSPDVEKAIFAELTPKNPSAVRVDCENLSYISSSGLRILLRTKKAVPETSLFNVSNDIYEILEVTGFTEILDVEKAYRKLSVEGCEVIGKGANGKVYRIDRDTIVKVYRSSDSLQDIQRERELARKAFILGIPTAIPYDVVRVGDSYGSVFELLNTKSFCQILREDPAQLDRIVRMSSDLLKLLHATEVEPGVMPDAREVALERTVRLPGHLPDATVEKLRRLIRDVPFDLHIIHGDYHIKNVMLNGDEPLLIDMDTLCTGHPVFEFGSVYNAYIGFSEADHNVIQEFFGFPFETGVRFWNGITEQYFSDRTPEQLERCRDKARIIGYSRILNRLLRRGEQDTPSGKKLYDLICANLTSLVESTDTLLFD